MYALSLITEFYVYVYIRNLNENILIFRTHTTLNI